MEEEQENTEEVVKPKMKRLQKTKTQKGKRSEFWDYFKAYMSTQSWHEYVVVN